MGAINLSTVWDRGLGILNTVRDTVTNTILAMLGDEEGDVTESAAAEWWQHIGFASRPSKPEKGKGGPQAVCLVGGDRDACIASRDTRCNALYAALDYGEFCVYAPGEDGTGQGRIFGKKDGSVFLYTRQGNSPAGAGMTIGIDATQNRITLLNASGFGIIIDDAGVRITAGGSGAGLTLGSTGAVTLAGTGQTQIDGATVLLGSVAVPAVNAAVRGPTGISAAPSPKVLIE